MSADRHGAGMTQAHSAHLPVADFGRHRAGFAQLIEQVSRPWQKRLARRGESWLTRGAFEQRRLQAAFHVLDLPAQRRLRDEQAFSRCTEAATVGDFHEVAQLTG